MTMIAATTEPPVPPPGHEIDDEFQRRVDELLAYRVPWWRDAAFLFFVGGLLCLALAGGLWLAGH